MTVTTIHQRLRDERGLAVSIASFRRYVAANVPEETRRSQVKVLRPWPAEPGAEAQIDYGRLGRWLDPAAAKPVTVWAFVMVLASPLHRLLGHGVLPQANRRDAVPVKGNPHGQGDLRPAAARRPDP